MNMHVMRRAFHDAMLANRTNTMPVRAGVMTRTAIAETALSTMLLRTLNEPQISEISDAEMLVNALDATALGEEITGRSLGTHLPRYLAVARQLISFLHEA